MNFSFKYQDIFITNPETPIKTPFKKLTSDYVQNIKLNNDTNIL